MSKKIIKTRNRRNGNKLLLYRNNESKCKQMASVGAFIKELNIKTEETIAIGDNVNDIQMIKNAGLGIAMDNSADYIKQYADYITTDNNLDGVAEAINKYIE